eukprot:3390746-Pyramimonas_sp.AAC.1
MAPKRRNRKHKRSTAKYYPNSAKQRMAGSELFELLLSTCASSSRLSAQTLCAAFHLCDVGGMT